MVRDRSSSPEKTEFQAFRPETTRSRVIGNEPFRLGDRVVDPSANSIEYNGSSVRVEPKAMKVLICLVEYRGQVVGKEELIGRVWADTFVTDDVLKRCISALRKALADDSREPQFIETIPRGGYRLLAAVQRIESRRDDSTAQPAPLPPPIPAAPLHRRMPRIVGLAVLLVILAIASWRTKIALSHRQSPMSLPYVLSRQRGMEMSLRLSPDGKFVAFFLPREDPNGEGLYIKEIGRDVPLRITAGKDYPGAWAPDGSHIAFVRLGQPRHGVYIVPAHGGSERQVTEADAIGVGWSNDGTQLAIAWRASAGKPVGIALVPVQGGVPRPLTTPIEPWIGDSEPIFSPDGRKIAFLRRDATMERQEVFVVPATGGPARQVTRGNGYVNGVAWTSDSREVVFAAGVFGIMRTLATGDAGEPQVVAEWHGGIWQPTVSQFGNRLAFCRWTGESSLWRASLRREGPPEPLAPPSAGEDFQPDYSPDGKRLAFSSTRGGSAQIWIAGNDGSNPHALTSLRAMYVRRPRWSPDGRRVAFSAAARGEPERIYVVNSDGSGEPVRLTSDLPAQTSPSWSHDGGFIYFSSNRTGIFEIWRMPAGSGRAEQLTSGGGRVPVESADGTFLYFIHDVSRPAIQRIRVTDTAIPRIPVPDQQWIPERILDEVPLWRDRYFWTIGRDGLYYWSQQSDGGSGRELRRFDLTSGRSSALLRMDKRGGSGIAVSPDGQSVVWSQYDNPQFDIMVLDDFR